MEEVPEDPLLASVGCRFDVAFPGQPDSGLAGWTSLARPIVPGVRTSLGRTPDTEGLMLAPVAVELDGRVRSQRPSWSCLRCLDAWVAGWTDGSLMLGLKRWSFSHWPRQRRQGPNRWTVGSRTELA